MYEKIKDKFVHKLQKVEKVKRIFFFTDKFDRTLNHGRRYCTWRRLANYAVCFIHSRCHCVIMDDFVITLPYWMDGRFIASTSQRRPERLGQNLSLHRIVPAFDLPHLCCWLMVGGRVCHFTANSFCVIYWVSTGHRFLSWRRTVGKGIPETDGKMVAVAV